MNTLENIKDLNIPIDVIQDEVLKTKNVSVSILRLDKIHSTISGNKIFKLHYFLQRALSSHKKIITFGGAYSNHLAATAAVCRELQINCVGIIRGERPASLSKTLMFCEEQGMHLKFINRSEYKKKNEDVYLKDLESEFGEYILITEGGYSHEAVEGAEFISKYYVDQDYTHICCSVGTGTTLAGLIKSGKANQQFIGFSTLKNLNDFESRMQYLLDNTKKRNYKLMNEYHFGGYAKKTNELISFMNAFNEKHSIPTDFVYTGKMMYGILDLVEKNYFSTGSKILCVHTGGLQGNLSLPEGLLHFN